MLYLQEIEINPKAVTAFFDAIELKGQESFTWEEIYAFFFATENTPETNQVLLKIKNSIITALPQPNTLKDLMVSFEKFYEDNSKKLDRYEFRALLKEFNVILDGRSERFLLSALNFWDTDGMIEFEKLRNLIESPDESFEKEIELHNLDNTK
jgi:Ca2+-binding EF-hand superfamily protein